MQDLEQLVASVAVHTADQVDSAAQRKASAPIEYPPALFAAGTSGLVTAEFVVSAEGVIEKKQSALCRRRTRCSARP